MKAPLILLIIVVFLTFGCDPCNHNWEKVSEVTLPSAWEQIGEYESLEMELYQEMFTKKYILILKCTKCSHIKKIVEENP